MAKTARHTVNHGWVWLIAILFLPDFTSDSAIPLTPPTIAVFPQALSAQATSHSIAAPTVVDKGAIAAKPGIPKRRKGGGSR